MRRSTTLIVIALMAAGVTTIGLLVVQSGGGKPTLPKESEESLRAALQANPKDAAANRRMGDLLAGEGFSDRAMEYYQTAIAADPNDPAAPYSLATLLAAQGKSLEAQKLLEKNLKQHPDDPATNEALADLVVKSLGDMAYPTVKPLYEKAAADPGRPRAALGLAKIAAQNGDLLGAAAILQKAVAANPHDVVLHQELAANLAQQRRYDEAGKHYDLATALQPKNAEAWAQWGSMLVEAGDPVQAERRIRTALELQPTSPAFHVALGRALREQRRIKDALEQFEQALDLDDKNAPAYYETGLTEWQLQSTQSAADAEHCFRSALALDHNYTLAKVMLARLLVTTEDPARHNDLEAMDLFGQAVAETHEQDVSVLVAYAHALGRVAAKNEPFRDAFFQRALETIDKAIALGQRAHMPPEQHELLLQYRMSYLTASVPESEGSASLLSFDGALHDSMDDPIPQPAQPPVANLLKVPLDLSKTPITGNDLDKALRTEAAPGGSGFPLLQGSAQ